MEKDGTFNLLPKKEVIGLKKEYDKLNKILCGIRDMYKLPSALFIVDPSKEDIAIKEARILNIPVFGIVDTNCDPDMVDYVIPGNDDAIRAVKLITGVMANAIVEANGGKVIDFVKEDEKAENIMEKALETVKRKEDRPRRFDNNNNRPNRPFVRNENRNYDNRENNKKSFEKAEIKKEIPAKAEPVTVKEEKAAVDYSKATVAELRDMAKAKDVKGYSTMKKAELLEALK